jgi:hypothetical protein
MKEYIVRLPYVDEHEQDEGFVEEILEISNGVDDDARPVFVTEDQSEAIEVARKAREICHRYSCEDESRVFVESTDVSVSFLRLHV